MTLNEQIAWCKLQIKSGYEVVPIKSILTRLKNLEKKTDTPVTYNQSLMCYKDFLRDRGLPFIMDARQGAALKSILKKLMGASVDKSDEGVLASWKFILKSWNRTGDFIGRQIKLSDIDRNLLEILDKIRNGATKKQANLNEAERFRDELTKR
ncbi:hypothetical protein [Pedobacter sp. MW01-1-1]|uniref:hypothetical protein n=1 Tax=Pedobacter sp. MW01-1-1 TaxID=3383027 RepID=UPI003FEE34DD